MKTIRIITQGKMYKSRKGKNLPTCDGCAFQKDETTCIHAVEAVESAIGWRKAEVFESPAALCQSGGVFVEVQK